MSQILRYLALLVYFGLTIDVITASPGNGKQGSSRSVHRRLRAGQQSSDPSASPSPSPAQGSERDVHFMPPMQANTVASSYIPTLAPGAQHMHRHVSQGLATGMEASLGTAAAALGVAGATCCVKGCIACYKNEDKQVRHCINGAAACAGAGCLATLACIPKMAGYH